MERRKALGMSLLSQEDGEIMLQYEGKESEESILKNTKLAYLKEQFVSRETLVSTWRNYLIYGDNLSALKTLCEHQDIKGKVQLSYIDPPFASGREFNGKDHKNAPAYKDLLRGAEFIEFLRKRLIFLREILAKDGSIYVHIDWKMGHYVRVLMDEIFKPEHFVNDIARIKCNPKNFDRNAYGNVKDTILMYSKGDKYLWNGSREKMDDESIERLFPHIDKDGRRYTTNPLHAPDETKSGPTGQPWNGILPPKRRHWRYPPEELTRLDKLGLIVWSKNKVPRKKIFADDVIERGKKRQDIWDFKDPAYPRYPTEKNLEMMKTIIEASSNKDDLVLDCFSGSGSTLVASEELGRRWIGIDSSKTAIRVTQERLVELQRTKGESVSHYPYALYEVLDKP